MYIYRCTYIYIHNIHIRTTTRTKSSRNLLGPAAPPSGSLHRMVYTLFFVCGNSVKSVSQYISYVKSLEGGLLRMYLFFIYFYFYFILYFENVCLGPVSLLLFLFVDEEEELALLEEEVVEEEASLMVEWTR